MQLNTIKWDGKKIRKPGMYAGIPLEVYHGQKILDGPSVSSSNLRKSGPGDGSLAHFYDTWSGNPNREEESDKAHFVLGRAAHHLTLGEPYFNKMFAIQPDTYWNGEEEKPWNNNATICRNWHKDVAKAFRTPLTPSQVEKIKGISRSLATYPLVREGILNGLIERSIFYKHKKTGLWIKVRPDVIPTDSADFADLKTTSSVFYRDIHRSYESLGYYRQAALVRSAAREVLGLENSASFTFTFLFVESSRPHCVVDYQVKSNDLDLGEEANEVAIERIASAIKANVFPGPNHGREGSRYLEIGDKARERMKHHIDHAEEV